MAALQRRAMIPARWCAPASAWAAIRFARRSPRTASRPLRTLAASCEPAPIAARVSRRSDRYWRTPEALLEQSLRLALTQHADHDAFDDQRLLLEIDPDRLELL